MWPEVNRVTYNQIHSGFVFSSKGKVARPSNYVEYNAHIQISI